MDGIYIFMIVTLLCYTILFTYLFYILRDCCYNNSTNIDRTNESNTTIDIDDNESNITIDNNDIESNITIDNIESNSMKDID
jgi:hypothetical protein